VSTRSKPFKLAIVGCGKIATAHVEAALASGTSEVVALVDPARERAEGLAERFNLRPAIATSIGEIGAVADGAVIATPNHTHADLAEQCLSLGISVLIEKPLALNVVEGERICEAARRYGGTVAVGYVSRFRENVRLMACLIRSRYFGRIHRFAYQFGTRGGWAPVSGYNLDRRTSGGGVLVTTGTHFIDRMLDWFGYPEHAILSDDSADGPEANALMHVRYDGNEGLVGTARFSKTVTMPAGFAMETDRGTVLLRDRPDAPVLLRPANRPDLESSIYLRQAAGGVAGDEFVRQLNDFVAAVQGHVPPVVTAEQGLRSLQLLEHL
jgi:predicted dehydrogenase